MEISYSVECLGRIVDSGSYSDIFSWEPILVDKIKSLRTEYGTWATIVLTLVTSRE